MPKLMREELDTRSQAARYDFIIEIRAIMDARGYRGVREFDPEELRELAESVAKDHGLPIEEAFRDWRPWA